MSFKEYLPISGLSPVLALREHMTYGGLPQVVLMEKNELKIEFLKELFQHTYMRDVLERYKIKNNEVLEELLHTEAGTTIMSIYDFLLLDNSLDL